MTQSGKKTIRVLTAFILTAMLLLACVLWSALSGGVQVSAPQLIKGLLISYDRDAWIVFDLRFPRIAVALLGGAVMAVSGALLQAVTKNPLAEPGIIGINSGSALFAALLLAYFPQLSVLSQAASFLGGIVAFGIVYILSQGSGGGPLRLILVGIAVEAFFSGAASFFSQATGESYSGAASIVNANIQLKSWQDAGIFAVYAAVGIGVSLFTAGKCNLLMLSDETVRGLGVNINRTRLLISLVSVFLASAFTSVIGAVSFLGLIAPHIARLLIGTDYRILIPYCALLGALILLFADTLGRTVAYPYEISAAVVMSVIGGPVFIILLLRSRMFTARRA